MGFNSGFKGLKVTFFLKHAMWFRERAEVELCSFVTTALYGSGLSTLSCVALL